jgi:hypothetical protein
MRALAYACMVTWCLFGIPTEKWYAMTDAQQDAALEEILEDALQETGCEEVEVTVYESGSFMHIYGKCSEEKYIAGIKSSGPNKRARNERRVS